MQRYTAELRVTIYSSQVVEEFRENSTLHNLGERAAVILPRLRRLLSLRRQEYNVDADMEEEDLASTSLVTGGPCYIGPTEALSLWGTKAQPSRGCLPGAQSSAFACRNCNGV